MLIILRENLLEEIEGRENKKLKDLLQKYEKENNHDLD